MTDDGLVLAIALWAKSTGRSPEDADRIWQFMKSWPYGMLQTPSGALEWLEYWDETSAPLPLDVEAERERMRCLRSDIEALKVSVQ